MMSKSVIGSNAVHVQVTVDEVCKGKGACGGVGHECAAGNACKGQGWLSLTKPDCDAKKGTFKAG